MSTTRDRTRLLALVGLVITAVGALWAAVGAIFALDPGWGFVLDAIIHLGELAVLVALLLGGAVGTSRIGRAGLGAAMLGELVLVVAELVDPVSTDVSEPLYTVAPLLIGLGMIGAGIVALRGDRRDGWRRVVPLLLGVVTIVVLIPAMAITGGPPAPGALAAIVVWELTYVLLAAAVLTGSRARTRLPVAA